MYFFYSFLIGIIPSANAADLNQWGNTAPGVSAMWTAIGSSVYTSLPVSDLVEALTRNIVHTVFSLIGGACVLLVMYAGIRMIVARGKEDEFTQGKTIITWALVGLVLSMFASVIVSFFEDGFLPQFLQ